MIPRNPGPTQNPYDYRTRLFHADEFLFSEEGTVYQCEVCHKAFDKYKNLFRHVKTHKVGNKTELIVVRLVTLNTIATRVFREAVIYFLIFNVS